MELNERDIVCRKNVQRRLQLRNARTRNKRRMKMKKKMLMSRNVLRLLSIQVY